MDTRDLRRARHVERLQLPPEHARASRELAGSSVSPLPTTVRQTSLATWRGGVLGFHVAARVTSSAPPNAREMNGLGLAGVLAFAAATDPSVGGSRYVTSHAQHRPIARAALDYSDTPPIKEYHFHVYFHLFVRRDPNCSDRAVLGPSCALATGCRDRLPGLQLVVHRRRAHAPRPRRRGAFEAVRCRVSRRDRCDPPRTEHEQCAAREYGADGAASGRLVRGLGAARVPGRPPLLHAHTARGDAPQSISPLSADASAAPRRSSRSSSIRSPNTPSRTTPCAPPQQVLWSRCATHHPRRHPMAGSRHLLRPADAHQLERAVRRGGPRAVSGAWPRLLGDDLADGGAYVDRRADAHATRTWDSGSRPRVLSF